MTQDSGSPRPPFVPVLMYHDIGAATANRGMRPFVVPPGLFEEHLSALTGAGYRTAPLSELTGVPAVPPARTLFLTFDDGYVSYGSIVVPLFERFGMTGTVFVPTAFVGGRAEWLRGMGEDSRRLMGWKELRDVIASGSEVGGHGHNHLPFDLIDRRELHSEVVDGRRILEEGLGTAVTSLAYPFGYHNQAARRLVRSAGYQIACEVGFGPHQLIPEHRFSIRRLLVGPDVTAEDLLAMVTAAPRPLPVELARRAAKPAWRTYRRIRRSLELRAPA